MMMFCVLINYDYLFRRKKIWCVFYTRKNPKVYDYKSYYTGLGISAVRSGKTWSSIKKDAERKNKTRELQKRDTRTEPTVKLANVKNLACVLEAGERFYWRRQVADNSRHPWRRPFKINVGKRKRACAETTHNYNHHWTKATFRGDRFDSTEDIAQTLPKNWH